MYRVYLVDDDAVILAELRKHISWLDNGYELVGEGNSPTIAMIEIPKLLPDVVICDLKMEPYDGIEMMEKLKEMGITPYFLMLSAYGSFENSRRFFLEGGYDYLLKPLHIEEVQLALDKLYQSLGEKPKYMPITKGYNPVFGDLLVFLQKNYAPKHSLDSLGRQFGLSPNYICALFSKHCDTTLTRYVTDLRMTAAKEEIRKGKLPLKVIASQCGYNDYRYFNRVFKDYCGVSPGQYSTKGEET